MISSGRLGCFLLFFTQAFAWAQEAQPLSAEAWLLQIPEKFSEVLIASYHDPKQREKLTASISKFDKLVKAKTFTEIARFSGGGTAEPETENSALDDSFLYYPDRTRKARKAGKNDLYRYGVGDKTGTRTVEVHTILPGANDVSSLSITTAGALGKEWSPTAILQEGERSMILLERDPKATIGYQPDTFALSIEPEPDPEIQRRLTWYLSGLTAQMPLCRWHLEMMGKPFFSAEIQASKNRPTLSCRSLHDPEKLDGPLNTASFSLPTMAQPSTTGLISRQEVTAKATIRRYLTDHMRASLQILK